jgi:hypothetical protein
MLTIKDLSASKELDRAAMGAVAGGEGAPSFALSNYSNDLFDILGAAYQSDVTAIANVGNHGSTVYNVVDNDKSINV